ncbi:hypothetical protein QO002_002174 [Pararhizobium capsulatum DSM 1112]|uniref:Transmembrane protein n=1 Tax=Pararhizobium capsulatum DSM 1112 TaxID=1121113 RepID=A0ABU0BP60_9HYPH|nr:hypothetical protein [Pararhizobium capsulatum]MDQ0320036.1 hypothetical protein [Pararhizobium capsulatum DSM 1112]
MRYYRHLHGFYSVAVVLSILLIDFFRPAFVYAASHTWQFMRTAGVVAYRKIADLRPVYLESFDTHGLSLDPGRMR